MNANTVVTRVPATSANLGPGFDSLCLALDLWNKAKFSLGGEGIHVQVKGEGEARLPEDHRNLIFEAFQMVYNQAGQQVPGGLRIECENGIPLGSGLGSSAAAVLSGVMAANAFLKEPYTSSNLLRIAADLEGHADNVAAALYGGLVAVFRDGNGELKVHKLDCAFKNVVVVLPDFDLPTKTARKALPKKVPMGDAVFNIGHVLMTAEALRCGNRYLLMQAMEDRLHQPYRIDLIPGAREALDAARKLGAPAALSGAGPSLVAFAPVNPSAVVHAMQAAFSAAGITSRTWQLDTTYTGIYWEYL